MRGYAYVPESSKKSKAKIQTSFSFDDEKEDTAKLDFSSGFDDDFLLRKHIETKQIQWSPCGKDTTFRISSRITASKKKDTDEDAEITVDTIDGNVNSERYVRFCFTSKKC